MQCDDWEILMCQYEKKFDLKSCEMIVELNCVVKVIIETFVV